MKMLWPQNEFLARSAKNSAVVVFLREVPWGVSASEQFCIGREAPVYVQKLAAMYPIWMGRPTYLFGAHCCPGSNVTSI